MGSAASNLSGYPQKKTLKKLERRVKSDAKKLEKQSGKLPKPGKD